MSTPAALEDLDWPTDALAMIEAYAASGIVFSSDDIRRSMRPAPSPSNVGAAFRAARLRGLITATGFTESATPSRKRGVIRTWCAPTKERA